MSQNTSSKLTMNVEKDDFKKYKVVKENLGIDSNIKLFTIAALFGKFIANDGMGERKKIKTSNSYFRVNDNLNKDELVILKCLAISENDDLNIINDPVEMFKICEEYANAGFKKLLEYADPKNDFEVSMARDLLKHFDEVKD